jgi:hypothetical protein
MNFKEAINNRLEEMTLKDDSDELLWPENCAGSRNALVVFIGPSPGGEKEEKRRELKLSENKPLWNKPYKDPLEWSSGFRVSFKPIVETIFGKPYEEAAKLIARFNLDWMPNPESEDVALSYMREGCSHILPIISECKPSLVIPMDKKTFGIFQDGLILNGYDVDPVVHDEISIRIWDKDDRASHHKDILAIKATKDDLAFLVINSFQHPARIFDDQYALRIGNAIKLAADQIWNGEVVSFVFD